MNMASLADMTRKLAFLLILASARKNSEVWAFSADVHFGLVARKHKRPSGLLYSSGKLSFLPEKFGQKTTDSSKPTPEYKFRCLLCAFIGGTRVIYPSRQCQGGSDI